MSWAHATISPLHLDSQPALNMPSPHSISFVHFSYPSSGAYQSSTSDALGAESPMEMHVDPL